MSEENYHPETDHDLERQDHHHHHLQSTTNHPPLICPSTPPSSHHSHSSSNNNNNHNNNLDKPTMDTSSTNLTAASDNLIDLPPLLRPSKLTTSASDSESSDSISERLSDDEADLLDSLSLAPEDNTHNNNNRHLALHSHHHQAAQRTPASQNSLNSLTSSHISLSEPGPIRNNKFARKRSLSALVALRYRGGKVESEIGDEERGLLALDLDTYINSGDPDIPETRALPPSALFPTLSATIEAESEGEKKKGSQSRGSSNDKVVLTKGPTKHKPDEAGTLTIEINPDGLLLPTPRSEWPFGGGTGPGKTSRGFIPGRSLFVNQPKSEPPSLEIKEPAEDSLPPPPQSDPLSLSTPPTPTEAISSSS